MCVYNNVYSFFYIILFDSNSGDILRQSWPPTEKMRIGRRPINRTIISNIHYDITRAYNIEIINNVTCRGTHRIEEGRRFFFKPRNIITL